MARSFVLGFGSVVMITLRTVHYTAYPDEKSGISGPSVLRYSSADYAEVMLEGSAFHCQAAQLVYQDDAFLDSGVVGVLLFEQEVFIDGGIELIDGGLEFFLVSAGRHCLIQYSVPFLVEVFGLRRKALGKVAVVDNAAGRASVDGVGCLARACELIDLRAWSAENFRSDHHNDDDAAYRECAAKYIGRGV